MAAMPKRNIEEFISHWSGATASEQSISQQFLCELCDLLDVPQPDNKRNGSYTFEFHVSEPQHDGETKEGRIDLYKRACFVLESKKFQEAIPEQTDLELSAEKMGAIAKRKKSAAPVRDTDRWDDAMLKALVQAERYTRALPADEPIRPLCLSWTWGTSSKSARISRSRVAPINTSLIRSPTASGWNNCGMKKSVSG
jgi:hypothetical protein